MDGAAAPAQAFCRQKVIPLPMQQRDPFGGLFDRDDD